MVLFIELIFKEVKYILYTTTVINDRLIADHLAYNKDLLKSLQQVFRDSRKVVEEGFIRITFSGIFDINFHRFVFHDYLSPSVVNLLSTICRLNRDDFIRCPKGIFSVPLSKNIGHSSLQQSIIFSKASFLVGINYSLP